MRMQILIATEDLHILTVKRPYATGVNFRNRKRFKNLLFMFLFGCFRNYLLKVKSVVSNPIRPLRFNAWLNLYIIVIVKQLYTILKNNLTFLRTLLHWNLLAAIRLFVVILLAMPILFLYAA